MTKVGLMSPSLLTTWTDPRRTPWGYCWTSSQVLKPKIKTRRPQGKKTESSPPQVSRLDSVPPAVSQMWYDSRPHSRHRSRGADPALRLASYSELWTGFHRRAVLWAAAMTAAFEPVLKVELTCAKKINCILLKLTLTGSYILIKWRKKI